MTSEEDHPAERVKRLMSQFVDGELSSDETAELNELVNSDPSRLEMVADQLLLDSLLTEELGVESMTALVDLVSDAEIPIVADSRVSTVTARCGAWLGNWRKNSAIRLLKPAGWFIAISAMILVAFVAGRWENSAFADASSLVRAAMVTHAEPIERVYVVDVERAESFIPDFATPRDVRVMTQGDRFWVEMSRGEKRWMWGQDADDAIWMTLGLRRALRIERDELGVPLQYISDIYSLNLETLLDSVLQHFQVTYSSDSGPTHVITATARRRWQGRLREMTIEVEKETRVIRKLVIRRNIPQHGESTVTFTLVDSRVPDETLYRPEGHLTEPFRILTRVTQPDKRREMLTSWFGSMADRWIKSEESKSNAN